MNIVKLLDQQVRHSPEQVAIIHKGQQISFAQLKTRSEQASALLSHLGLQQGDTLLVLIPMSIELYIVLIAIWRLGGIAMFVDPSAGKNQISQYCQQQAPAAFIGTSKAHLLRLLTPSLRAIPIAISTGSTLLAPFLFAKPWHSRLPMNSSNSKMALCQPETPALITFTSGSTGLAKGTVRSHGFLSAQNQVLAKTLNLSPGSTNLATLPIFALINLANGISSLIPSENISVPAKVDGAKVLAEINRYKAQSAVASPAFFERLIAAPHNKILNQLEQVFTGGAPVFPHFLAKLQACMPDKKVCAVFGSTEAEPIAEILFSQMSQQDLNAMAEGKGLLTGLCIDDIHCCIINDVWGQSIAPLKQAEFKQQQVPVGQVGEIVVNGKHVLKSYLAGVGDEENKFKVEAEIWHRTGDLGYFDQGHRLWLLGRCSAKIDKGQHIIYPFALETAAMQIPGVKRAALCQIAQRSLLIIDSKHRLSHLQTALAELLSKNQIDQLVKHPIPLDKRHNAKVDYPALIKSIEANYGHRL